MTTVVLTDSTACLPAAMAQAAGVDVLPLHVVVGGTTYAEGVDIDATEVAALLRKGTEKVSTSRPAPGEFVQRYRELLDRTGCSSIVSLHLSHKVSGTVDSARMAAAAVSDEVRVEVIDSGVLGMAMGYAACSAGRVAAGGAGAQVVAEVARQRAAASNTYFYLDTLEHLRRGGRVGTAAAIVGSALAIKPLLTLAGGEVQMLERVRTRAKALARLEQRCIADVKASGEQVVDVAVHHLGWPDQAVAMCDRLRLELGTTAAVDLVELGAVTGVHTGPGTLAVVVSPRPAD